MLFNSFEFLIFFLIFIGLWSLCRAKDIYRWGLITIASLFFYAWWDWRFVFLIIFSGIVDYKAGLLLDNLLGRNRKAVLLLSLILNIGLLGLFKYSYFLSNILQDIISLFFVEFQLTNYIAQDTFILPLGISFYTFQSMSYTIDVYRGRLKPTKNILHFFSFLVMFPQLVAGPIVRAKDLLNQLKSYRVPNYLERWHALKMVVYGLFRKVVIADNLAFFIDGAYQDKINFHNGLFWLIVSVAFSFQIYNDFSGYSLIARGLAKYLGYHFKMNFNHPYLSKSFQEFWGRWHISLSKWFRDYVYIPLGGSKRGVPVYIFALLATMLLSGIWHGANYTFIIWAVLHSVYILMERVYKKSISYRLPELAKVCFVFFGVTIAWVYFRAANIREANTIVETIFRGDWNINVRELRYYSDNLMFLILGIWIEIMVYIKSKFKLLKKVYSIYNLDVISVVITILFILLFRGEGKQFIYFQF